MAAPPPPDDDLHRHHLPRRAEIANGAATASDPARWSESVSDATRGLQFHTRVPQRGHIGGFGRAACRVIRGAWREGRDVRRAREGCGHSADLAIARASRNGTCRNREGTRASRETSSANLR